MTTHDGFTYPDSWSFTCTGSPEADELQCISETDNWEYSPEDGLEDTGELVRDGVVATRQ